ncbi:MAG: PCMD domain-containing protein, partial [Paramuribaculum sp.]|nr:PCMD domain-containing protein [Paramuribaculum sp.]
MSRLKIFASSLCTAALLLSASLNSSAQQLPNNGFEGSWSTCTPWTGGYGNTSIGQNPTDWCISHVMGITTGVFKGTGKKAMGEKTNGYNSSSAVKVYNDETGAMGITRVVPGYLTLGTTWSTAEGTKTATHDGGSWGGISFSNKPDGVSFYYKREYSGSDQSENASFIAYLWKGEWTQANVPVTITTSGSASKTTMTNRDRNILSSKLGEATTTGGTISHSDDAELIASVIEIEAVNVSDWTKKTIQFEYCSSEVPTMLNIIFSANEYFNTKFATKGNSLYIDDVKLIYYSRLKSISYTANGKTAQVPGFDSQTYDYEISVDNLPTAVKTEVLSPSGSSKATVTETSRTAK